MSDDATPAKVRLTDWLGPLPPQRPGQARTMSRASGDKWDDRAVDLDQCESWHSPDDVLARIAAAVAAERERCAQECDRQASEPECPERARYCAEAIRANAKEKS